MPDAPTILSPLSGSMLMSGGVSISGTGGKNALIEMSLSGVQKNMMCIENPSPGQPCSINTITNEVYCPPPPPATVSCSFMNVPYSTQAFTGMTDNS